MLILTQDEWKTVLARSLVKYGWGVFFFLPTVFISSQGVLVLTLSVITGILIMTSMMLNLLSMEMIRRVLASLLLGSIVPDVLLHSGNWLVEASALDIPELIPEIFTAIYLSGLADKLVTKERRRLIHQLKNEARLNAMPADPTAELPTDDDEAADMEDYKRDTM